MSLSRCRLFLIPVSPTVEHALIEFLFRGGMPGMPEPQVPEIVREILLGREVAGIVVRIFIAIMVSEFSHELGGRIAQWQGHGLVATLSDLFQGCVDTHVSRVALRARSQVDRSLGQRYASLRPSYLHHHVEGGVGQQQGVGIGQSDVLSSRDDQTAGDELRVFPTLDHPCHPIRSRGCS